MGRNGRGTCYGRHGPCDLGSDTQQSEPTSLLIPWDEGRKEGTVGRGTIIKKKGEGRGTMSSRTGREKYNASIWWRRFSFLAHCAAGCADSAARPSLTPHIACPRRGREGSNEWLKTRGTYASVVPLFPSLLFFPFSSLPFSPSLLSYPFLPFLLFLFFIAKLHLTCRNKCASPSSPKTVKSTPSRSTRKWSLKTSRPCSKLT